MRPRRSAPVRCPHSVAASAAPAPRVSCRGGTPAGSPPAPLAWARAQAGPPASAPGCAATRRPAA
eukprot:3504947-Pleurochrysis_carterae.AAC.1